MSRIPMLALVPALTFAAPVIAQEEYARIEAGGHLVRVIEAEDFMRALEVDGVVVSEFRLLHASTLHPRARIVRKFMETSLSIPFRLTP